MLKKKKLYMFSLNEFTSFAVSKWARTVAVVAEKNRVLLRVSFRSIACTTGVLMRSWWFFCAKRETCVIR